MSRSAALPDAEAATRIPRKYPRSRAGRAALAKRVVHALQDDATRDALDVLERAITRGTVVRDPREYLRRIERFQQTGEWRTAHLASTKSA
jgi:hypothetical protein